MIGNYNAITADIMSNSSGAAGGIYLGLCYSTFISGRIGYNQSLNGSGLYLEQASDISLTVAILGNRTTTGLGSGVMIVYSTNVALLNCAITNNGYNGYGGIIHLFDRCPGLIISNCVIGGTNNNDDYGIYEQSQNTTGQVLVNNIFLTNRLKYLYYDYNGAHIVTNDDSWTNINDTAWSGAATAGGNIVTIM